jgi:hypothetical protein
MDFEKVGQIEGPDPILYSNTLSSDGRPRTRGIQPWRHSVSHKHLQLGSHTVREFNPRRQRMRLFAASIMHLAMTIALCGVLAACLKGFSDLPLMTVAQVKAFNALMTLTSIGLGASLTSALKEYSTMIRWRILTEKYRSLEEFDLILGIESLRRVIKLLWISRPVQRLRPNPTQALAAVWIFINVGLQVLVALIGLTYNLNTAPYPELNYGRVSIANLSVIRDIWGEDSPSFSAQLGSANYYGIQGQDYNYVPDFAPGQGDIASFANPNQPTIYCSDNWKVMQYYFQNQNLENSAITQLTRRSISTNASCVTKKIVAGGNGTDTFITYQDDDGTGTTIDIPRVGPGAMTFIGVLNSTCGPRCSQILALQSADGDGIRQPAFFQCQNTVSLVHGIEQYIQPKQNASLYQLADVQARIMAGAIGWTGFNYTQGDQFQYVRYSVNSWWSPNGPATADVTAEHIMEYTMGAIAAFDYNGPRQNVTGYYPVTAQTVSVLWTWVIASLCIIPLLQFLVLLVIVKFANTAIIKDDSAISTARLLRPLVDKLGSKGCLLTGKEISRQLSDVRIKYGYREPTDDLTWSNSIRDHAVRHVDLLEECEGVGVQGPMPPGTYDGWYEDKCEPDAAHSELRMKLRKSAQTRLGYAKRRSKVLSKPSSRRRKTPST